MSVVGYVCVLGCERERREVGESNGKKSMSVGSAREKRRKNMNVDGYTILQYTIVLCIDHALVKYYFTTI